MPAKVEGDLKERSDRPNMDMPHKENNDGNAELIFKETIEPKVNGHVLEDKNQLLNNNIQVDKTEDDYSKINTESIFQDNSINLNIELPNLDRIKLRMSPTELVQALHQVLLEREDTCTRTCFSLQLDGIPLDNFAELKAVDFLTDESVVKLVEEPYTIREVRNHIHHIRDLLKSTELIDAYQGIEGQSVTFMNYIARGECLGVSDDSFVFKENTDCTPPDYILPDAKLKQFKLLPLHPQIIENGCYKRFIPECLKVLTISGWNPPPPNRKFHGDILYIYVVTLEDKKINITASTRGFFLNKSTEEAFNPKPETPKFLNHSLIDTLSQISSSFKKNFTQLLKFRKCLHPIEKLPSPCQVYSWLSPRMPFVIDHIRAEEAFSSRYPLEENLPGQTRDWNEELQATKELPRKTLEEVIIRERSMFKAYTDFASVSVRGAMSVMDGSILAINPSEDHRNQMFLWSNLFLSLGFDVKDHYLDFGSHAAAHVAPAADLKAVNYLMRMNLDGIYSLGTTVVDYRGHRIAVQSIVPGILEKDQEQSVVYGSFDFGQTIKTDDENYLKIMIELGNQFNIRPHRIVNKSEEEHLLYTPVECKGIYGNDKRSYVIDLLTMFPRDPNFICNLNDENISELMRDFNLPRKFPHSFCFFRKEFLKYFTDSRYKLFMIKARSELDEKYRERIVTEIIERSTELENVQTLKSNINEDDDAIFELERQKAYNILKNLGSNDKTMLRFKTNPNTFHPNLKAANNDLENTKQDEKLLLEAANFMLETAIPMFIHTMTDPVQSVIDGHSLKFRMHEIGINMRYLGSLIKCLPANHFCMPICLSELFTRSAKHIYRNYLQSVAPHHQATAIAHFLNCYLSQNTLNPMSLLDCDELQIRKRKLNKRKQKQRQISTNGLSSDTWTVDWTFETIGSIWEKILKDSKTYYGYNHLCDDYDSILKKLKISKLSLLRSFCKRLGIQLQLREYLFDGQKPTFVEEDILLQFPIVKYCLPHSSDAYRLYALGQQALNNNQISLGFKHIQNSLALLNNIYGLIHPDIAACCRLMARMLYILGDFVEAISMQERTVIIIERLNGNDDAELVMDYIYLALFYFAEDKLASALRCLYRARYLFLLLSGCEVHPLLALIDKNIGIMLHHSSEYEAALRFFQSSLKNYSVIPENRLKTATCHHLIAKCHACQADFRSALNNERLAHDIYNEVLKGDHDRTKESMECVKFFAELAVKFEIFGRDQQKDHNLSAAEYFLKTFSTRLKPTLSNTLDTLNMVNGLVFMHIEYESIDNLKAVLKKGTDKFSFFNVILGDDFSKAKEVSVESNPDENYKQTVENLQNVTVDTNT